MAFEDVCYVIHAAVAYFNQISIEDPPDNPLHKIVNRNFMAN